VVGQLEVEACVDLGLVFGGRGAERPHEISDGGHSRGYLLLGHPGRTWAGASGGGAEAGVGGQLAGTREPLRGQLRIALNNGVTKEEIVDLLIHLEAYAGAARAFDSYQIALETFAEATGTE
jgi:hypothetical protein